MDDFLKREDFNFADLRKRRSQLYIVIPETHAHAWKAWMKLCIETAIKEKNNEQNTRNA